MSDSKHKITKLKEKTFPYVASVDNVSQNRFMKGLHAMNIGIAQDHVPATGRRIVWSTGLQDDEFLVPTNAEVVTTEQTYPKKDVERIVARPKIVLTPGNYLDLRVLAAPSGLNQVEQGGGGFDQDGIAGSLIVTATFDNGPASETREYTVDLPGSNLPSGSLPDSHGGTWPKIAEGYIPKIVPSFLMLQPEKQANFGELTTVSLTIKHRGAPRIIDASIAEVPLVHAFFHTSGSNSTFASYNQGGFEPSENLTYRPQHEGVQGATNTEPRHGTDQMLAALNNASQRLGPSLLTMGYWTELTGTVVGVTDLQSEAVGETPITITITTFVDITNPSVTSWGANNAGWYVPAALCQQYRYNDPKLIAKEKYAVMPVRAQLYVSSSDNVTGTVRFQSSKRSFFEMQVSDQVSVGLKTASFWKVRLVLMSPMGPIFKCLPRLTAHHQGQAW